MRDVHRDLRTPADLGQQGQCRLLAGDVERSRIAPQDRAHGRVGVLEEVAGVLVAELARSVADLFTAFGVEVLDGPGQWEAGEVGLGDAVEAAVPQGDAVGGDRQYPVRALGGLRGDQVAGQEGVREHHALGHRAGERPHLVLTRCGEDHQAVLGVGEIDLGECLVELSLDVRPSLAGDRGIGLQLLLGLGHDIAQPDLVLGPIGLSAMRRRQHGHGRIRARAPQLGEGCGTECVLHNSTIGRIHRSGIRGNTITPPRVYSLSSSGPQELPSAGSVPYSRKLSTLLCTHLEDP